MSTKKTTQLEEKVYKSLSRSERLNNPIYKPSEYPTIGEHYSLATESVMDDKTNRVVKRMVKKLDSPNPHKHLKVSDFCLENLQASGAIEKIKPCSLSHDVHTSTMILEHSAHNIINSSKSE